MDIVGFITVFAIVFECAIAILAILIATRHGEGYGWLIAITFALFALFDGVRIIYPYGLPRVNSLILLAACASMLYATWLLYNDTGKNPG
jgi:uncharacterized membrane protein YfbV (UPF0208 family)